MLNLDKCALTHIQSFVRRVEAEAHFTGRWIILTTAVESTLYSLRVRGHCFITENGRNRHRHVTLHRHTAGFWRCCFMSVNILLLALLTETNFTCSAKYTNNKIMQLIVDYTDYTTDSQWSCCHPDVLLSSLRNHSSHLRQFSRTCEFFVALVIYWCRHIITG